MLKLPYSISNFKTLVNNGYHFVDRTPFVARLEQLDERYVFFLRPRRFGKSLFVSLLQYYYGIEHKAAFQDLFGRYEIGQNPSPRVNSYLVLKLDFSRIYTQTPESTAEGFLANVKYGVSDFLTTYAIYFDPSDGEYITAGRDPSAVINRLFERFKRTRIRNQSDEQIYILIDEYDHFANELLAFRFGDFKESVSRNGFVRKFYESIKTATGEGVVDRLFVTGVSPLTLDSLTSGFNIGTDLTTDQRFNHMLGFLQDEVEEILQGSGVDSESLPQTMSDVRQWYNGYRFYQDAPKRLYNPDMVLYFAKEYARLGRYPDDLLDTNIASDYGKIRRMFGVAGQEAQNFAVLNELITDVEVTARMTRQFSFERAFTRDDFISLLFYMGIVTVKGSVLSRHVFEAPNDVIKQLYYDFFNQIILEQSELAAVDINLFAHVTALAQDNDIAPLIEVVESLISENDVHRRRRRHRTRINDPYQSDCLCQVLYLSLPAPSDKKLR